MSHPYPGVRVFCCLYFYQRLHCFSATAVGYLRQQHWDGVGKLVWKSALQARRVSSGERAKNACLLWNQLSGGVLCNMKVYFQRYHHRIFSSNLSHLNEHLIKWATFSEKRGNAERFKTNKTDQPVSLCVWASCTIGEVLNLKKAFCVLKNHMWFLVVCFGPRWSVYIGPLELRANDRRIITDRVCSYPTHLQHLPKTRDGQIFRPQWWNANIKQPVHTVDRSWTWSRPKDTIPTNPCRFTFHVKTWGLLFFASLSATTACRQPGDDPVRRDWEGIKIS